MKRKRLLVQHDPGGRDNRFRGMGKRPEMEYKSLPRMGVRADPGVGGDGTAELSCLIWFDLPV